MFEYEAEAMSRKELRTLAYELREELGLIDSLYFPVVEMLDVMCKVFPGFNYIIVPNDTFPESIHADTNIQTGEISIKETVYDRACRGEGRDRMNIAHAIGHYILVCFLGYKLTRNYKQKEIIPYRDPEWQAKCFAGELLIPKHLVNGMEFYKIMDNCGVSTDAARYQIERYRESDPEFNVL